MKKTGSSPTYGAKKKQTQGQMIKAKYTGNCKKAGTSDAAKDGMKG